MTLTRNEVKRFYDHFGSRQDSQAFYEDAALHELIAHGDFSHACSIFELGCGTGRLALRLLQKELPESATYLGSDLSDTMLQLSRARLAPFAGRATVLPAGDKLVFALQDKSVDRVLSCYVLDLMSETDIVQVLREAKRVLVPGGKLCLASLTRGVNLPSKIVCGVWRGIFNIRASLVGGCRPISLLDYIAASDWRVDFRRIITQFGVPTELIVATPLPVTELSRQ